jgi:predicted HicB family RNase H-like nuclease
METKKKGRPPKRADELHSESLLVRVEARERQAFQDAARAAGMPLSAWVRERLRRSATRELKLASLPIAFRASSSDLP